VLALANCSTRIAGIARRPRLFQPEQKLD
jgi:hypothetical protein